MNSLKNKSTKKNTFRIHENILKILKNESDKRVLSLNDSAFVEEMLRGIMRKRALLILLELRKNKKLRYMQVGEKLCGISPSALSTLLKQLNSYGLVRRQVFGKIPPIAVEYSLTKEGTNFLNIIEPVLMWLIKTRYPFMFDEKF